MAYSDYDQGQIVAQIQAFFQLKREVDPRFLDDTKLSSIDGGLGGANSNTNNSIRAWLEQKGLTDEIRADDPQYLEKIYHAVRTDLVSDPAISRRLEQMTANPDALSEEQREMLRAGNALHGFGGLVLIRDPAAERQATAQAAKNIKDKSHTFSTDNMDDEATLSAEQKEAAGHALGFLKQNGLASDQMLQDIGEIDSVSDYRAIQDAVKANPGAIKSKASEITANPAAAGAADIYMMQAVMGLYNPDEYATTVDGSLGPIGSGAWASQTLAILAEFAGAKTPEAGTPDPTSQNYQTYFMNNVVLASDAYSVHTRKVWEDIKTTPGLAAGQAIENYLVEYAAKYREANDGKIFTDDQKAELRELLVNQVAKLHDVETKIKDVRPTPELIADNFIATRVLPELDGGTKIVLEAMKNGATAEQAIQDYMENGVGQFSGDQKEALQQQITREVQAVTDIRQSIIDYENMSLTQQDALEILENSWKKSSLPQPAEHYSDIFKQKVALYESAAGGALDSETAIARAAVDVRAQIDRDRGVSERVIVDENHGYYQNDISEMGEWLRDRVHFARDGGVSPELAESYGVGGKDFREWSKLDFYTSMYGSAYRIYRDENLKQSMKTAYDQARQTAEANADAKAENEGPAQTEPEADAAQPAAAATAATAAAEPSFEETYEPGPPALDFGENFQINNPFRMTIPIEELENSEQISAQALNLGNAMAAMNPDGTLTLEQAALAHHTLHDEDFARGLTDEEKSRLGAIAEELGIDSGAELETNDPRLLEAMAAYANQMKVADLPEEWKQGFAQASSQIQIMEPPAEPEPVEPAEPEAQAAPSVEPAPAISIEEIELQQLAIVTDMLAQNERIGIYMGLEEDVTPESALDFLQNPPSDMRVAGLFIPGPISEEAQNQIRQVLALEQQRDALIANPPDAQQAEVSPAATAPAAEPSFEETYEPGPPALDFGEEFQINNPFRMTIPIEELENSAQISAQALNLGNAMAAMNPDGALTLEQAALAHHTLHDEDFARGLTNAEQQRLTALGEELGVEPGHQFSVNDPRLMQAVAAYANETTMAALPAEWTQAFTEAGGKINMPAAEAAAQASAPDVAAATIPEPPPAPEAPAPEQASDVVPESATPVPPPEVAAEPVLSFGEATLDTNNPFRTLVPVAELDETQIVKQTANLNRAMAISHPDGLTLEQAALVHHSLHSEDFTSLSDEQKVRLNDLAKELGVEPDHQFSASDPRLTLGVAAYANETTIAALPEEWKEAFEQINTQLSAAKPEMKAAPAQSAPDAVATIKETFDIQAAVPVPPPPPAPEPEVETAQPVAPETEVTAIDATPPTSTQAEQSEPADPAKEDTPPPAPRLTETFGQDAMLAFTGVNEAFVYEFTGTEARLSYSIEDSQFRRDAYNKYDAATQAFESGDPVARLQAAHNLASFIHDGLESRELALVKENWGQLYPYFERVGETVGPQDYEKGVEVLREKHTQIIDETYNHRGASVRELLRDRNAFNNLEHTRATFDERLEEIEKLAAQNGIALDGVKPEAPTPAATPETAPAAESGPTATANQPPPQQQQDSGFSFWKPSTW